MTLCRFYNEYKTLRQDIDNRWEDWIHANLNLKQLDPWAGKYALQLLLRWSVAKITLYGVTPILLSLATGFWYMTLSGDDRHTTTQTAWTISSYIITCGGVGITVLAAITSLGDI